MFQTIKTRAAAVPAIVLATAAPAFAAVPSEVSDALTEMKADALVVAGLVLVAIIALAAFKFIRRAIS